MLALVYSFFIYKGKLEIVTMLLICLKEWGGTHSQWLEQCLATDSAQTVISLTLHIWSSHTTKDKM